MLETPQEVLGNRFELLEEAGRGGMATVFRAHDRHTNDIVAVKLMHSATSDSFARFARESKVLAELEHPGIVRYVAHGNTAEGVPFLAMEWLLGEDLATRIARRPLDLGESIALIARVADGLAAAHARGIVHRDIKPSNLFLPNKRLDGVKILDFGVAQVADATHVLTGTGMLVGTVCYMAPEQARAKRELTPALDVFALGCVLYECITGSIAFSGTDLLAVLAKIVFQETPRLREVSSVPDELDELVARMMAKQPDERPPDGAAVAAELRALEASVELRPTSTSINPPAPIVLTTSEQRLVSVVLATSKLDITVANEPAPELAETRSVSPHDQAPILALGATRFGAEVERLVDGSIAVMLSGVGSATDLACRAARCAVWLRALLPSSVLALATGRAVMSSRLPVGAVIDRATALLAKSKERGAIRVDDVTGGLLDAGFELDGDDDGLVLIAEREAIDGTRKLLGRPTTCVGRDRELATLAAIFTECRSESVAHAALVVAPGGVGKSRLRHELVGRLLGEDDSITVLSARGDPMSAGSPFGLIAPLVRRAIGIHESESLAARRGKLRARVARAVPEADRERVTEFLAELVGFPYQDVESVQLRAARQEPLLMGDQMRRAWEDWLAAECATHPVLLVLEDLHWGDLPSVQFVDAALRNLRDRPLMVLALARPDVHTTFPQLWSGRSVTELRLDGLSKKAAERLVREVLGTDVEGAEVARLIDRAAGNAFYLEELIRAVADGKRDLPETVLAMAHSRLEGLPFDARRLLRAASVFGMVFWGGAVAQLVGGAERETEWLSLLEQDEVIERRGVGMFPGEVEYAFRHALLREAAYGMLTDDDRTLGHRLAALWLERAGERQAAILAEHFERGGEPGRAIAWYRRAAEQAFEGNDFAAVSARAERGIVCGAKEEMLGALELLRAEAYRWQGRYEAAEAAGIRALVALPRGGAAWHNAAGELAVATSLRDNRARLETVALDLAEIGASSSQEEALPAQVIAWARATTWLLLFGLREPARVLFALIDAAEPRIAGQLVNNVQYTRDPAALARIHYAHATAALCAENPEEYRQRSHAAAGCFDEAGNIRSACVQRHNVGNALLQLGDYEAAELVLRASLDDAERMGLLSPVAEARHWLGLVRASRGDAVEAERLQSHALEAARAAGSRRVEAKALAHLALLASEAGDPTRAEELALRAVEVGKSTPAVHARALASLARIHLAAGRTAAALDASAAAVAMLGQAGAMEGGEVTIRLTHAEALLASGDVEAAREVIAYTRARLEERAARLGTPSLRQRYLEGVPENARTLALAATWTAPT